MPRLMERLVSVLLTLVLFLWNLAGDQIFGIRPPQEPCFTLTQADSRYQIASDISSVVTTNDQSQLLEPQASIHPGGDGGERIQIYPSQAGQAIAGFGASLTDSSAYLIHQVLDETARSALMIRLFSREGGIGLSFLRQPMGASDFAREAYTYDDMPAGKTDYELHHFSIAHDEADILPLLRQAKALNPELTVMATPWSPPAWMKTGRSLTGSKGGILRPSCYGAYARYFVKFIEAYAQQGIPVSAVTVQNEPNYAPETYPGMKMGAVQQVDFINNHLGPAFEAAGISTKILCYDHNWDNAAYAKTVLTRAGRYVGGSAWHVYGGDVSTQSLIHSLYPEKEIYFTEDSGGEWVDGGSFSGGFPSTVGMGIRALRNHSRTFVLWNLALDEQNGPVLPTSEKSTCRGVVTVNQQTGEVTYNLDYYALGHFSKFIRPGAVRLMSDSKIEGMDNVVFRNPDGTVAMVLINKNNTAKTVCIAYGEATFSASVPAQATMTFCWQG